MPPSGELIFGMLLVAGIFSLFAVWVAAKMPWPMYGRLIPLWSYGPERSMDRNFVIGFAVVIAAGSVVLAVMRQWDIEQFPTSDVISRMPVVEGKVTELKSYVIPADEDGRNRWCLRSFEINGQYFDFSPGSNNVKFCSRDSLPKIIVAGDYLRIRHDGGRIYKIEKRRP